MHGDKTMHVLENRTNAGPFDFVDVTTHEIGFLTTKKPGKVNCQAFLLKTLNCPKISGIKMCTSPPVLNVDVNGTC